MNKLALKTSAISSLIFNASLFASQVLAQGAQPPATSNGTGGQPVTISITRSNLVRTPSVSQIIQFIIGAAIVFAILAALLFILIGAFQWITSGGDKAKVESARNHIIAAIIGLIVIVLAIALVNFVLNLLGIGSLFSGFTIPALQDSN